MVIGTQTEPVVTLTGIKYHSDEKGANGWHSFTVQLKKDDIALIQDLEEDIADLLATKSEAVFGKELDVADIKRLGTYSSMLYGDDDNLLTAKLHNNLLIVDKNNEAIPFNRDDPEVLSTLVSPGSVVRCVFKVDSLFFKTANNCKVMLKLSNVQVIQQGEPEVQFQFS